MRRGFLAAAIAVGVVATQMECRAGAGDFVAPDPEDLIFYQVFIDRFANGNTANDNGNPRAPFAPTNPRGFHGGDIAGIRQKLPYIRDLGCNAIWITPHVENVDNYHGYAAFNWYNVDPNFGTLADLQGMVSDAHALGIAVYFDMVGGHQGDLINSGNAGYPRYRQPPGVYTLRWSRGLAYPPPFNSLTYFHAHGHIGNYTVPEQELGELAGLDDLKTETTYVREQMTLIWRYWLEQTGVDGFRVDTVKHVERGFWEYLLPRLRETAQGMGKKDLFIFGEIYGADDNYMAEYLGTLRTSTYKFDAAVDFPFYYTSSNVFARGNQAPSSLGDRIAARQATLPGHHLWMPNFLDNHDVPRFLNVAQETSTRTAGENQARLQAALVWLYGAPGPPIVYYGTEQGFNGGEDPYNREDMFAGQFESGPSVGDNFDQTSPLYLWTRRLGQLRNNEVALRRGSFSVLSAATGGPGIFVFTRQLGDSTVLFTINTSTNTAQTPPLNINAFRGLLVGDYMRPTRQIAVGGTGSIPAMMLEPLQASVWLPASRIPEPDPDVESFQPANGMVAVSVELPEIRIGFTTPMNTAATEAMFSTTPAITGTLSWNAEGTQLVYTLAQRLTPLTTYQVSLAANAPSQDGGSISGPRSATWTTDRAPRELTPLPTPYPALPRTTRTFALDGSADDWPAVAGLATDTGTMDPTGVFLWNDAPGDDVGAGAYTYPTNEAFSGADADMDWLAVAYDAEDFHVLFKPVSVLPDASFYTCYFGMAIDIADGGTADALGFSQGDDLLTGVTDLLPRGDMLPDYELVFTGPRGATLRNRMTGDRTTVPSAYNQATGVVEIRVPRTALGLTAPMVGQRFNLTAYTALETFGSVREVEATGGPWSPGGGSSSQSDPDIFDMAGTSGQTQVLDLVDYTAVSRSQLLQSVLQLRLTETTTSEWMIVY